VLDFYKKGINKLGLLRLRTKHLSKTGSVWQADRGPDDCSGAVIHRWRWRIQSVVDRCCLDSRLLMTCLHARKTARRSAMPNWL